MHFICVNEYLLLASQYSIFSDFSIAALIIAAALFIVTSWNQDPSIPLYVPEKSTAGSQKTRWLYDSAKLLQEAYKKVRK